MILQEQHAYAWLKQKGQWLSQQLTRLLDDSKQKNTIASLDGIRAIACLTVLTFHISLMARDTHILKLLEPYSSAVVLAGGSGVTLFFVLSGFLLFLPYAKALHSSSSWPSVRLFYIRRIFRIVPAYYASLFLLILLFPENRSYLQPQHLKELVLFLLFFMDSTKRTFLAINGPFWTLAVEWQYYLLLPLLTLGIAFVARRGTLQHRFWKVVLCLLALIAWGCFSRYWGVYFTTHPTQTFLIRRSQLNIVLFFAYGRNGKYLEDFSIGMLISLCYVFAEYASAEFKARFMAILGRLSPWLFGTGIVLLYFMAMWHFNQWYYHRWPFYNSLALAYDIFNEFGLSLGFGLCVTAILFGSLHLKHFFEWTPLRWIGLISYSLYMWHLPLLLIFRLHIGSNFPSLNPFLAYSLYWLWALLVIIPFSFFFYIWIEKPWIQVGARLLSPKGTLHKKSTNSATVM